MPSPLEPARSLNGAFDYPRLMARLDGDRELFKELVAIFMEEHTGWLVEIRRCIAAGNAADLAKIAHQVRGAAGHFGARHVASLAAALENIGRTGALAEAEQHVLPLEAALAQLRVSLQHFSAEIDAAT